MSDSLFLRLKSLNVRTMRGVTTSKNVIRVAAMHNLREIQAELGATTASGIDPTRIAMNYQLRGPDTAAGVADLALALLDNVGVKNLRRDACMALELVFSLPPAVGIDHREYFAAAVAWADSYFNAPILSAAVHLDEAAPHCHVLVLPLVAGRMNGGALAGGPSKIRMMQSDFQQQVGQRFGLTHQPRAKRLNPANTNTAGRMMLEAMQAHPERLNDSILRDALAAALGQHHATLMPLLGLALPATAKPGAKVKTKSFVSIMTASKPERKHRAGKYIDVAHTISIDVEGNSIGARPPKIRQRLCSVDIARPSQAFQPNIEQPSDHLSVESASPSSASDSATGQQASSSSAAQPSTTGQQRERSTTGKPSASVQNILHTPLVVTTNPADQAASTSPSPRKRATKPRRAASTLPTESATGTVSAVDQVDQLDGKRAMQQAGHRQDAQDRAAADEQAGQHTSSDVAPATAAPTKRATTRGQNETDPMPIGHGAPASSSTGKRKRTTSKVVSTAPTTTTVTAQHQPASAHGSEIYEACPSSPVTSSADQVGQAVPAKRPAKSESTGPAKLASTTAKKRELTAAKRSASTRSTTSTAAAAKDQATRIDHETPCNANASHATPSKRVKTATAVPTSAPAAPRAGERKPATCSPSKVSSPAAVASTASLRQRSTSPAAAGTAPTTRMRTSKSEVRKSDFGPSVDSLAASSSPETEKCRFDICTDQPDEIRRLGDDAQTKTQRARSTGSAAPASAITGEFGNDTSDQPDEIRTLGLTPASLSGTTTPAGKAGEYRQTDENGRHDATTTAQRPALAPSTNGSATAPQAAPAYDVESSPQCVMPEPARTAAPAPPIGGPLDGARMLALEGDLQHQSGADDYDRHRDDEHRAEHWDIDLGEFVTAPATPARRNAARTSWPEADDLGDVWHEARPAALDAAMASIRAVCG
jgi:hypothetical protein